MAHGASYFEAGQRLGRFRLVAPLGEGAMGRVWQVDGPSGPAAIKLLSHDLTGMRERFGREAQVLLKLRHPNVVRAMDYGLAGDGTPFLALELLEGESLENRLERTGPLPIDEAVAVACAAADGLQAAHELGIIHRDVKPGNIFLCTDLTVKVLDFGLAFFTEADGRLPVSRLTRPGVVMGTPAYMAPEQAAGNRDEDERTDVWGLGATLYDAISGREPFAAAGNYFAELTRILTEPPDPLPDEVPPQLAGVIFRALAKPRAERFQSMAALAAALHARSLTAAVPPQRPRLDAAVMGALSEEIRLVSAALVEGLDEDDQPLFLEAVGRHGGVGSPVRGRGAVAVFGGDAWLGDEAERAVKMGLEVRPLVAKIAIGTGKAVRRLDQPGMVTGQAITAAQKALSTAAAEVETLRPPSLRSASGERAAAPAALLVCPETERRIRGGFDIAAGRVIAIRPGGRALQPREVGGREVPFVGRDEALDRLIEIVDDADLQKRAAAVLLAGPPGIGKSRMRFELLRWLAEEEVAVRQLEARGELVQGRSSLGVFRELLRRHAELPEGVEPQQAREKIGKLVASAKLGPETARGTADFIGELLGVPFDENPHLKAAREDPRLMADRLRLACGDLLDGWTKQGFVLISVEDAQWADAASLRLLDSLLTQLGDRPLAVVATVRPAFFVEHVALQNATRIELEELPPEATAAIVESVLGRVEPAVVERAAGNPYLAEELSLAVREGADPDTLPLTVEGTVLARLDKLAPDEKDLLKRAAVLGRRFWREALEAMGEPLAGQLLGNLRRRELLIPRADSRLLGCDEWLFRQAIVYEVCRGLLTPEQSQALHQAAGRWLSRHIDAAPEQVAEHFETAGVGHKAILWWLRAVHAAHGRGDSRNVIRFSERVQQLGAQQAKLPPSELLGLHLLRGEAFYWLGERDRLEAELHRASDLAADAGALVGQAALAQLLRWQAVFVQQTGHLDQALFASGEAVRLADASNVLSLRVQVRATLSRLLVARGELQAAAVAATEALEIAKRAEGSMIRATAARALANVEAERGNLSSALFYYHMARNLCLEVGGLREATRNGLGLGSCLCVAGDYEQARRILEKTLHTAETLDLGPIVGWVKHQLGLVLHRLGQLDEGRRLQDDALSIARSVADVHLAIAALQYRSIMQREAGEGKGALESAEQALQTAERHGNRTAEPLSRTLRAQALVAVGRFSEALEECGRAFAVRDAVGGMLHSEVELLLARYDALTALGRPDQALATLRTAYRCFAARLATIEGEPLRRAYTEHVPAHARLASLRGP